MDPRIFEPGPMHYREEWLSLPLEARLTYEPSENLFFINFEGLSIRRVEDVDNVRRAVEQRLQPVGRKVLAIVNYDNFRILPELLDGYTDMVKGLADRFYSGVTRYTTSAFMHMKFGDALQRRSVAPHIYESREEAERYLYDLS